MADTANPDPTPTDGGDPSDATDGGGQIASADSGDQVVRKKKRKRRLSLDIEEVDASEVLERKISA